MELRLKKKNDICYTYRPINKTNIKEDDILKYIEDKIKIYNYGYTDIKLNDIFQDKRKGGNNTKHDLTYIQAKYKEAETKYLQNNPNKKRLSFSLASKLLNISDKTIKKALNT